jgi:hypothetical protein
MSQFVNYKKRSVTLPPGCKNLIDLLRPRGLSKLHGTISPEERPTVTRGETVAGKLSEIQKYVGMMFESHAQAFTVMVSLSDERLTVDFARMTGEMMLASVVFEEDAERERLMRDFFARHGLQAPRDRGRPEQFHPDLPVQLIYRISPLPSDARLLSMLTTDLFHDVCGLSDDSELMFRYYEIANAA